MADAFLTPQALLAQTQGAKTTYAALVCSGVILWDWCVNLPSEVWWIFIPMFKELFRGRRPSLPSGLLFTLRAVTIPFIALEITFTVGKPTSCQATLSIYASLFALVNIICVGIFVIRTLAIRASGLFLKIFLWTNLAGIAGFWIYWASHLRMAQLPAANPYAPWLTTCSTISGIPQWLWGLIMWQTLTDFIILVLTIQSLAIGLGKEERNWQGIKARWHSLSIVSQQFYIDAVCYFAAAGGIGLIDTVWIYYHRVDIYAGLLFAPQAFVCLVVAPRVVNNLKLVSKPRDFAAMLATGSNNVMRLQKQRGPGVGGTVLGKRRSPPTRDNVPLTSLDRCNTGATVSQCSVPGVQIAHTFEQVTSPQDRWGSHTLASSGQTLGGDESPNNSFAVEASNEKVLTDGYNKDAHDKA